LRVDPIAATACLRCFNPPRERTPDSHVQAQVAAMDEIAIAGHARAVGTDSEHVREWALTGGCGRIADALLDRLRPSDGNAAQFSVGFMSVFAGVLLAAQVAKDAVRRTGDPARLAPDTALVGGRCRFVANLLDPANAPKGVRRYGRDVSCPACLGVRAEIWAQRWTG
jgi:hypothetical protein